MANNYGFQNEYDFVLVFNNKKIKELNPIYQELVYSIFNNIKEDDIIKCWRNHFDQKSDIFLKIGKAMKGISIKMGSRNSVHVEFIGEFTDFLLDHSIPQNIIDEYLRFHYADGTLNNTGKRRISAEEYKKSYQKQIDEINKYFNNEEIVLDAIDRFVLRGNNSKYDISALILGIPDDFLWCTKSDIVEILCKKKDMYCSSPHFSSLICQPMNRCMNYNKKYEKGRQYVQIKWYNLFDDIIRKMNDTYMMICECSELLR